MTRTFLLHPTEQLFHQCTADAASSRFSATQTFVISLSSKEIRIPRYPKISPSSSATRNSASSRIRNVKIRFLSTESKSWPPLNRHHLLQIIDLHFTDCDHSLFLRSPVFSPHRHASQIPAPLFHAPPAIFSGIPARALPAV